MRRLRITFFACLSILSLFLLAGQTIARSTGLSPQADQIIYADALVTGWENWSWGAATNLANASPHHGGSSAIAVTINATQWGGLYLHTGSALNASDYAAVRFWIHGGSAGGQDLAFKVIDANDANWDVSVSVSPSANAWTQITVTLSQVGSPVTIGGLVWQDTTGGSQPAFYVDDIVLVASGIQATPPPPGVGPALSVDAAADLHPISPDIYGMNFADQALAQELHLPVDRRGGNSTSRYNWLVDATNTGSDWYFENVPESSGSADLFVDQDRRTGTETILTMPLIGWVAKARPNNHPYDCGFKISRYGNQQDADWQWDPDCGNGVLSNGTPISGNNPLDTSTAITPTFVAQWVNHLKTKYGSGASGGVFFYNLDNEPMLWNSTHRDVHPNPTSYDELRDRTIAYAAAIKAADPGAKTLGPVVWGWCAYFYSALDGCTPGSDRQAHGNLDFVEWYLQQMQAYDTAHSQRILDYVDVHAYPQASGVALSSAGNAATQALRLRSTRSLWDSTYTDESWISQPVRLIPRMKQWVSSRYPGTKLAITEYNWGGLEHINGALTQADVLGIFGREGLDLATIWGPPASNQPGAYAFRMYRNYDGQGHAFGETSLRAISGDQGPLSIYAARRSSDASLTVIVINKTATALTSTLSLANFSPALMAQVYRYSTANLNAIVRQPDQSLSPTGYTAAYPANSISLVVIPPGIPLYPGSYLPLVILR